MSYNLTWCTLYQRMLPVRHFALHQIVKTTLLVFMIFAVVLCDANGQQSPPVRVGFSAAMLGQVNKNDALAAISVWAQELVREKDIQADPKPLFFSNIEEISTALKNKAVDCVNLSTEEYIGLRDLFDRDNIITGVTSDSITEVYVLLVRRSDSIKKLADLRGRSLYMLQSSRALLIPIWLESLLSGAALGSSAEFFGRIKATSKVSSAVLPLFFGRFDACVVTRKGFEIMVELNPQIGQQLNVLAASPPYIPTIFCFRADFESPVINKMNKDITSWHLTPSGRQILTIFQIDRLKHIPVSYLESTLNLLMQQRKFKKNKNHRSTNKQ